MSRYVRTEFGRFNIAQYGRYLLWECPKCGAHGGLSEGQLSGTVSVVCSGHGGHGGCDYHETHPFGPALIAAVQANLLVYGSAEDRSSAAKEGQP